MFATVKVKVSYVQPEKRYGKKDFCRRREIYISDVLNKIKSNLLMKPPITLGSAQPGRPLDSACAIPNRVTNSPYRILRETTGLLVTSNNQCV